MEGLLSIGMLFFQLTSQDKGCSYSNDGTLWCGEGWKFVEVVNSILEEEWNLDIQYLK